jgi:hypothetical protein
VLRDIVDPTASPRRSAFCRVAAGLACSFVVAFIGSSGANAGTLPTLKPVAYNALRSVAGSYRYAVDCTYGPQDTEEEGLALPPYHGERAQVFVRPWICAAANRAASGRWNASNGAQALALLVLVHESVHVSPFVGARVEHLTECRALTLFPSLLAALHAPARVVPAFTLWAAQAHERLLASDPLVYGPACSPLDGAYS